MLHHSNAPLHVIVSWDFLTKTRNTVILQTAYLPDLAPAECFLFPSWNPHWKGADFHHSGDKRKFTDLKVILKQEFKECCESWK